MSIVYRTQNGIEMSVNHAVLKLQIKTVKILFWSITKKIYLSITQNMHGLLRFYCHFLVSWTTYYKMYVQFFQKGADIFEIEHAQNILILGYGCSTPLKNPAIME